MKPFLMVEW